MGTLSQLGEQLTTLLLDARGLRLQNLIFAQESTARLAGIVLAGLALLVLIVRSLTRRASGRGRLALPSLIEWLRPRRISIIRHGALLMALAGLPFFALALADPKTALAREEASYPGRRISADDRRLVQHAVVDAVEQAGAKARRTTRCSSPPSAPHATSSSCG